MMLDHHAPYATVPVLPAVAPLQAGDPLVIPTAAGDGAALWDDDRTGDLVWQFSMNGDAGIIANQEDGGKGA